MSALLGVNAAAVEQGAETPAERTRELYELYGQRVFTFCYSRLRNREEAQDAAQTTFIYVMRSLERGIVLEFELAWILKIAFNVCRGTRRSAGHRLAAANKDLADVDELPDLSNSDGLETNERLEALRDGLQSLPENQRRAILLREWQGLSYAEIADELGLTVGAVETLLFRARRNLSARLEHVRGSFAALNLGTALLALRSLARGLLAKLALIGAAATVGLVPLVAERALQARASGERVRPLVQAGSSRSPGRSPEGSVAALASTHPGETMRTGTAPAVLFRHRAPRRSSALTAASSPKQALPKPSSAGSSSTPVQRSVGLTGSSPAPQLPSLPLPAPALASSLGLPALPVAGPENLPSLLAPSSGLALPTGLAAAPLP